MDIMQNYKKIYLVVIMCLWPICLYAAGNYYIGKDEGGIYFQTDHDGGWYIDNEDLRFFRIGESGTYTIERDRNGIYLLTDKRKKFYIDASEKEKLDQQIAEYNKKQQNKITKNETKVIIKGNRVLVPVILGYREKQMEVLLLLDTGASVTILHRNVVDKLRIKNSQNASIMVAGGSTIKADVVKFDFIRVGPKTKENIFASLIDHKGMQVNHQGLLGMNFLKGLDYTVDFKRQVISWR